MKKRYKQNVLQIAMMTEMCLKIILGGSEWDSQWNKIGHVLVTVVSN